MSAMTPGVKPSPADLARLAEQRASDLAWTQEIAAEYAVRWQRARALDARNLSLPIVRPVELR